MKHTIDIKNLTCKKNNNDYKFCYNINISKNVLEDNPTYIQKIIATLTTMSNNTKITTNFMFEQCILEYIYVFTFILCKEDALTFKLNVM